MAAFYQRLENDYDNFITIFSLLYSRDKATFFIDIIMNTRDKLNNRDALCNQIQCMKFYGVDG